MAVRTGVDWAPASTIPHTSGASVPLLERMKTTLRRVGTGVGQARVRHMERHRPTGFRIAIFDGIRMVRPDHWDSLVAERSVCLSRPFLELLEAHAPRNLRPHYALAYRGETPVAAIAAQSLEVTAAALPKSRRGLAQRSLARIKERILVCGNLLTWGPHGVALAPDADPAELWPAVAEALYRIRRSDRLFGDTGLVMVKDLALDDPAAAPAMRRFSYRPFETEPNMRLELKPSWTSFEAYLKDMKSDYRSGIKKQLKDIDQAGLELLSLDAAQVEAHAQELHGLYLQVHDKQKLRLVTLEPSWIPALARHFGPDFRTTVLRARSGGPLLGFVTTLRDGEGAIGYYIGFDRKAAEGAPLYLRLLYAIVEDAIALRAAWISLGRTALQPKAKLGAKPQPLFCLLRHRVQAMNLVVGSLLRTLPEPEDAPERNPFK
jgi:hypothetical protein